MVWILWEQPTQAASESLWKEHQGKPIWGFQLLGTNSQPEGLLPVQGVHTRSAALLPAGKSFREGKMSKWTGLRMACFWRVLRYSLVSMEIKRTPPQPQYYICWFPILRHTQSVLNDKQTDGS